MRIVLRRSSFGLSPYFVLLGTTSGTCAFANILVLPTSREDMACCHQIDGFACVAGLLGIAQVGVQWSCFTVILLLFLIFFPRATPTAAAIPNPSAAAPADADRAAKDDELQPSYRTALGVAGACIIHALVIIVLSFYFIVVRPQNLQGWANFLGIFSTVLASIQYFPQIYTTFRLKRVGSLSIPMMCIQTPGSFVWAGSLAARLGPSGWSAWGVYLVTGSLQGTLLVMAVYFELGERRRQKQQRVASATAHGHDNGVAGHDEHPSEETPLLRDGR